MNMSKMAVLSTAALASMSTGANAAQRIAVPSYIYPGPAWSTIEQGAPSVGMVIVNPNSGPGDALDPNYQKQVHEAQAHGIKVLGYVATSYGKKAAPDVEREIDTYERWYGVDGFLLDEAANTPDKLPYYASLKSYIVKMNPHAVTVINPGTQTIEGYMAVADVIIDFEGSYTDYKNNYVPQDWRSKYSNDRFWHIVYSAATVDEMMAVVGLAKGRNAGWVYVTSEKMPNPYGALPSDAYWSAEVEAVR